MYYERFERLCELNNVKPGTVLRMTGVTTATITSWKQGRYTPKTDKLQKLADYFNVPLDFIMGNDDFITCPECHLKYSPLSEVDVEEHKKIHEQYKLAREVYGEIPDIRTIRQERDKAIEDFRNRNLSEADRMGRYEEFLRYDFLVDVVESGYSSTIDREKHDYREISSLRPSYVTPEEMINSIREKHGLEPLSYEIYYDDPEVAYWVQNTFDDPDMKFLFDMKTKMTPERFKKHVELMRDAYELERKNNSE